MEVVIVFWMCLSSAVGGWYARQWREDVLRKREMKRMRQTYATEHQNRAIRAIRRSPGHPARQSDADVSSVAPAYDRRMRQTPPV